MKNPKFYNKNGTLTAYALACGYVEKIEVKNQVVMLYMEHSHYNVRSGKSNEYLPTWETFEAGELTKARKLFNKLLKTIKNGNN